MLYIAITLSGVELLMAVTFCAEFEQERRNLLVGLGH